MHDADARKLDQCADKGRDEIMVEGVLVDRLMRLVDRILEPRRQRALESKGVITHVVLRPQHDAAIDVTQDSRVIDVADRIEKIEPGRQARIA